MKLQTQISFQVLPHLLSLEGYCVSPLAFSFGSPLEALRGNWEIGFPWQSSWMTKVLHKAVLFVWTATLGKALIVENLLKGLL